MSGPLNSSRPTTATLAGGVYNASTPAPNDGQAMALQVDNEGNLLVNIAVGGGGGTVTSKIEDSNGNPLLSNGAGALKVDGSLVTQPVSGTVAVSNFPTTQPVSGTVAVSNFPTTQPVSGSVSVSNFPATQPVSGTVAVSNFPATQPVSAVSLPLPSNAAQETGGNLATLAGTVTAAKVGVTVSNFPTTQAVSGTVTLGAGSAVIGHVITDTGSTTAVTSLPALVAGTALIGKVGIDQTTPGTTNGVQDIADGPVTAGTAATKSMLTGGVYTSTPPAITNSQQIASQLDTAGSNYINNEGRKQTFACQIGQVSAIAGINAVLTGSASKTVRITKVTVSGDVSSGSGGSTLCALGIAAPATGGTSSTSGATNGPYDSSNAASTATFKFYTGAPTPGVVQAYFANWAQAFNTTQNNVFVMDFGNRAAGCPVLRGTSQQMVLLINATVPTNARFYIAIEWTEE